MKKAVYILLNIVLFLSLLFSSGQRVHAQGQEEATDTETSETEVREESPVPEPGQEMEKRNQEETDEALPGAKAPEGSGSAEEPEPQEPPKPDYVPVSEIVSGTSYALAFEENGSYSLFYTENGELKVEENLSVLNEDTIAGRFWQADGEYGVYAIRTETENGTAWLYLDAEGGHLSSEARWGWEYTGEYLQYTDDNDNIYALSEQESCFLFFEPEHAQTQLFSGLSLRGTTRDPAVTGTHYIAFASDRHGNETAIGAAMGSMPDTVEYVSLVGDLVGGRGDSKPAYDYSTIYGEVHTVFSGLPQSRVSILWASHDENVNDDSEEGVTGVYCKDENSSGPIYTCMDTNNNPLFYLYGIAFYDMQNGSPEPAERFRTWVAECQEGVPVIVICHMPIHANRGDNQSAYYWNDALNYAATEGSDKLVRDVIFIHGHNHTTEQNKEYFYEVGDSIQVPAPGKRDRTGIATEIKYTYITGGYLNANKTATLIGISETEISMKKYYDSANPPGDNVNKFVYSKSRVQTNQPRLTISKTSLVLNEEGEPADLSAAAKNIQEPGVIIWESDNPNIASVSDGKVTPKGEGTAVITASMTVNGMTYKASCTVIVNRKKLIPSGNAFVLTNQIDDGQEYLIVSTDQAGNGIIFSNNAGKPAIQNVTIHTDRENGTYILREDAGSSAVWTAYEGDITTFNFASNGMYISVGRNGLSLSNTTSLGGGFTYSNCLLSRQGGSGPVPPASGSSSTAGTSTAAPPGPAPSITTYYVVYGSTSGQFVASQTKSPVYLFARKNVSTESGSEDTSGKDTSSAGSDDHVITCQMAGYPEGYAWNEEAKACQAGYLDENGLFHSTRRIKAPDTSDRGFTGWIFSLLISVSAMIGSLVLLEKYQ